MKTTVFKNDKFKRARGGYSRMLQISCEKCNAKICKYQKDGPGNLRRMYIDRIFESKISITNDTLSCPNKHILGMRIIYQKEKRPAFRLFVDSIIKKIIKI